LLWVALGDLRTRCWEVKKVATVPGSNIDPASLLTPVTEDLFLEPLQLYSTTLVDAAGSGALEWTHIPKALIDPNLDLLGVVERMNLTLVREIPSLAALPASLVSLFAAFEFKPPAGVDDASAQASRGDILRQNLDAMLLQPLQSWDVSRDPALVAFCELAAFSAVIPVEWSPIRKVSPAEAASKEAGAVAVPALTGGATAGLHVAAAVAAHGAAIVLFGAGGAVVGVVAAPLAVVGATILAYKLVRRKDPSVPAAKLRPASKSRGYDL
jgi:hypothetical protein